MSFFPLFCLCVQTQSDRALTLLIVFKCTFSPHTHNLCKKRSVSLNHNSPNFVWAAIVEAYFSPFLFSLALFLGQSGWIPPSIFFSFSSPSKTSIPLPATLTQQLNYSSSNSNSGCGGSKGNSSGSSSIKHKLNGSSGFWGGWISR